MQRNDGGARAAAAAALDYRPDIDGLRALAVMAVMAFHAFPARLPGGFIGVDVFFVISGYLITGIIVSRLREGRFSLAEFYSRRVRRIFPALIVVLAAFTVLGWGFLLPSELSRFGLHESAAAGFLSNIALWRERFAGYFDTAAEQKPLLHLWSLGVEEQFYIAWPLVLALLWRARGRVVAGIAVLAAASFALNVFLLGKDPAGAFYLPMSRAWELLAGGLLACSNVRLRRGAGELSSAAGTAAIAAAAALFSKNTVFPGFWALLPVAGAASVIAAGPRAWINRTLLSNRALVYVGLISYPLYLWHWPLLSFGRTVWVHGFSDASAGLALLAAFALSALTYHLVEKAARSSPRPAAVLGLLGGSMLLLAAAGAALVHSRGATARLARRPGALLADAAVADEPSSSADNFKKSRDFRVLSFPGAADGIVLFMGDSHIEQYRGRIKKIQRERTAPTVYFATSGGCAPLPGTNRLDRGFHCDRFADFAFELAMDPRVRTVVIGAFWEVYFGAAYHYPDRDPILYRVEDPAKTPLAWDSPGRTRAFAEFEARLAALTGAGKKVFLLLSNPTGRECDPLWRLSRSDGALRAADIDRGDLNEVLRPVHAALTDAARRSGAVVVDPLESLCGKTACPTDDEKGVPIYRDTNHLRGAFAAERTAYIDRVLDL